MGTSEPDITHIRNSAAHIYIVLLTRNKWKRSEFQSLGGVFSFLSNKKQQDVIIMA